MPFVTEQFRTNFPEWLLPIARKVVHRWWRLRSSTDRFIGRRPKKQIVICGYPRSGTSLLYNMFSTSLLGFSFDDFEISSANRIHRYEDQVTKSPMDIFTLEFLPSMNIHRKELLAIVLVRDLRDVLTSIHPKLPDRYFIGFDHSWWPQGPKGENWKYDAPGIGAIYDAIEAVKSNRRIDTLIIRYEDLVSDPDGVQKQLEARLGISFNATFSSYHQRPDLFAYRYEGRHRPRDPSLVREDKPVDVSRQGKWKTTVHSERIVEQFKRHPELFEMLISYGYERDKTWFLKYTDYRYDTENSPCVR